MQIEQFTDAADSAMTRLESQMEELVARNRLKFDSVTVEIFQGKIDLLTALGYALARVSKLQTRIDEIRDEVKASNAKEAA